MNLILHSKAYKLTFIFFALLATRRGDLAPQLVLKPKLIPWDGKLDTLTDTSRALSHSQIICPLDSIPNPQAPQTSLLITPDGTDLLLYFGTLQAKDLTLFGMFKPQTVLQIFLRLSPFEGSPTQLFTDSAKANYRHCEP